MDSNSRLKSAFPFFSNESIRKVLEDIDSILRSGVLTDGPHVRDFEQRFAEYVDVKHAVAVNSGTAALESALIHWKLKGKEVIVPTNTFVATPYSVLFSGGKPVFADIREDTLCIDPNDVSCRISPRTAGVIVVHIAGLICPQMNELAELCEERDLFLLEDAAHATGAMIDGRKAGALGDAGCFSFYPTKVITTGEGGMMTTDCDELAEKAKCMRNHGLDSRNLMVMMGQNWRLSEIAAVIGKSQLADIDSFLLKRNEIAKEYEKQLRRTRGISLFKIPENIRHSHYKYPVKVDDNLSASRLSHILRTKYHIETGNVYYPPCHLHPFFRRHLRNRNGFLPVAERVLRNILCLPIHVKMNREDVEQVSNALGLGIDILQRSGSK